MIEIKEKCFNLPLIFFDDFRVRHFRIDRIKRLRTALEVLRTRRELNIVQMPYSIRASLTKCYQITKSWLFVLQSLQRPL